MVTEDNETGKATCPEMIMYDSDSWHSHVCGRPGKVEFKGKHYCGIHDPIKKAKEREEKQVKWDAEYKKNGERHHRQSLMEKILGYKTTEELEQMAR